MSAEKKCTDVYSLLTDLSKKILQTHKTQLNYSFQQKSDTNIIKKLRSKAFEILLNKSSVAYSTEDTAGNSKDALAEILKHTFVLKCMGQMTQALQLETLVDELTVEDVQPGNTVYSVLQLLIELKSFCDNTQSEFCVFHYGKTNPALPAVSCNDSNIPLFQTYPIEVFSVSDKFETLLESKHNYVRENIVTTSTSKTSFIGYLKSSAGVQIESIREDNSSHSISLPYTPLYSPDSCLTNINIVSCFLPSIKNNEDTKHDYFAFTTEGIMATLPTSYPRVGLVHTDDESNSESWKSSNHSISNESKSVCHNILWDELDLRQAISNLHTWETLGLSHTSKQPLFTTDMLEVVIHLARIKQASTIVMFPPETIGPTFLLEEVPTTEFLKDVKLLLFGIESNSFGYKKVMGFTLRKNIAIHGVTPESLNAACQEVIHFGNCFKSLSLMVEPDPQSGKFQQTGVIFKAMCTSVKELLLYYRAALLRIFNRKNDCNGLIQTFDRIRPMATLLTEVARLCRRNEENNLVVGEGNGILTMIYEEVTRVTNPRVALVFYSILKSCCEVYFRFLQKWLFEGVCDDVYGEFMIKARPQYMRQKGHKFWSKSFVVCSQSVPGFLSDLTDSILQCGKAVRLLKICDPKNPVCRVFAACQPDLKVCLSVAMLREQLVRCQDYESKGEAALGAVTSLASAIQEQKDIEKEKADVAVRIQQNTIIRIKSEQEELAKLVVEKKKNLLKVLKQQASEVALHKEKEKEAELLADKLLLEKITQEQEEAENVQIVERMKLINYYEELASTIENRRLRSEWRVKRMSYHEKRVDALAAMRTNVCDAHYTPSNSRDFPAIDTAISRQDIVECNKDVPELSLLQVKNKFKETKAEMDLPKEHVLYEDENKNLSGNNTSVEISETCNTNRVSCTNRTEDNLSLLNVNLANAQAVSNKPPADEWQAKTVIVDIRGDSVSNQSDKEKNVYRRNNERSDLQEYLRTEVIHETLNANEQNEADMYTINRPTFLKFQKLDNMTAAQLNKMKMLRQEYQITPNNNEFSTIVTNRATHNTDGLLEHDNINKCIGQQNLRNNRRNWEMSHEIQGTLLTNRIQIGASITKLSNITEGGRNELTRVDGLLFTTDDNRHQAHIENNVDTPMSCTTDHFAVSSGTPTSQLPSCEYPTPSDISSDMLSSFEAVKSCPEQNFMLPENRLTFSSLSFATPTTPCATPSLTIADVKLIDNTSLQVYLEKSITVPLQVQSRLVNNALIKYLLNESNMLLHLHSLRSYFFLLNGEFAKSLTDALYARLYNISMPIELFNSATLTNLLERALVNSFSNSYINAELLSLSAVDIPHQLHISDPDALDCLCLNYKISWPLNIILDDMVMLQYSKVFKFLIMIGRVSWILQEDFNMMKVERKAAMSEQYHKLQLYRHAMTQFINALHNYVTCSVLHASWAEFEKDLQSSTTVDQVYTAHVVYIKKILSRCMLNIRGEKMRTCLNNVFKVILQFHNRLRSQAWTLTPTGYIHPNFKKLDQMHKAFCELRTYMAHVAFKYTTSGYQPHLIHFLNALNMNNLYDLTIKPT